MTEPFDEGVHPFTIDVPQSALDDLHERLDRVRWPDELPGAGWAYGVPVGHLKELVHYWRHGYDWRAAEAQLNSWPQFTTEIDGATVHFAHVRSPEPDAMPLLMTHGWPGSIVEFLDVAGPLTDPVRYGGAARDAVHLVLPSIPGFGFSGPTRESGWDHKRVAAAFVELMARLGYERYGVQGGDWGAGISREIGRVAPSSVIGVHLNLLPDSSPRHEPTAEELELLSPAERQRMLDSWERIAEWNRERQGYAVIQATRPQTLAYGLTDSPVGQLAWIAEKFSEWSDDESLISRDRLLTNVMIYWLTGTAGSSARIYYERAHADYWGGPPESSSAPTALAVFPQDNFLPVRHIADRTNTIVQWTEYDKGGHFPAMEQPELLIADIRRFFAKLR